MSGWRRPVGRSHERARVRLVRARRFLTRRAPPARHDLSRSGSETLSLGALLRMASDDELARWSDHGLGSTDPRGNIRLREAIAARQDGLDAEPVLCCCGVQDAVLRAVQTAGDWQPNIDRIEAALRPETRLVLMNYPNSPTGASLDPARLHALVTLCRKRGLWLINDEIYRQTEIVRPQSAARRSLRARRVHQRSLEGLRPARPPRRLDRLSRSGAAAACAHDQELALDLPGGFERDPGGDRSRMVVRRKPSCRMISHALPR